MADWQAPRGTRDFLPEETALRNRLYRKFRKVFERYGYGEIETPAFEDFQLLAEKSGEEIKEEIYHFKDKGDRDLGLRFDPTVPICRVVASNRDLPKPIKFYYITRMWRYERPQKGRYREFWQAGCELIGPGGAEADLEILQVAADLLREAGIDDFYFRINSRRVTEGIAREAGVPDEEMNEVLRSLDKLNDIGKDGVREELDDKGLDADTINSLFSGIEDEPDEPEEIEELIELCREAGLDNVEVDPTIVRGLDYYTGFVFETFIKGEEDIGSICSGGRYDDLVGIYGGDDLPAVGFGLGIDRMLDAIDAKPDEERVAVFVAPVNDDMRADARKIARNLRGEGISTETDLMDRGLSKQIKYADSKGIPYVAIVGPDELGESSVNLKEMESGEEEQVKIKDLSDKVS